MREFPVPPSIHPDSRVVTPATTIPGAPKNQKKIITGLRISQHPVHEIPHAEKLLKQCHRSRPSDLHSMDKCYDSDKIHKLIHVTLNSYSLIPVRNRKRKRISGYYRRRIAQSFDERKYHQRNMVETVFSILKRQFGGSIKARKY